jgi:hypothetical protein
MSAIDKTALDNYCRDYKHELLSLALLDKALFDDFNVLPGIKDELVLTTFQFKSLLKPYTKTWSPAADQGKLTPRKLKVQLGKVELEEEPLKYRNTYLAKLLKAGTNPTDHPFEQFFTQEIMRKIKDDIKRYLIWNGVLDPSGSDASDVNDGFHTIIAAEITALKLTPIVTGAITSSNAIDKFKGMYRALPKEYREIPIGIYCSYAEFDAYCDHYQSKNQALPYNTQFEQVYLEGSNKLAVFKPQSGYGTSHRVIMTPTENLCIGVDLESDQEKIGVMQNSPWAVMFYALMAHGVQIGTLEALFVNDQA